MHDTCLLIPETVLLISLRGRNSGSIVNDCSMPTGRLCLHVETSFRYGTRS